MMNAVFWLAGGLVGVVVSGIKNPVFGNAVTGGAIRRTAEAVSGSIMLANTFCAVAGGGRLTCKAAEGSGVSTL